MNFARYSQVLEKNIDRKFLVDLDPIDVGLFLGAIRLMLMHPEVEAHYSQAFKDKANAWRLVLLRFLSEMGFTDQEVRDLNTMYASIYPEPKEEVKP